MRKTSKQKINNIEEADFTQKSYKLSKEEHETHLYIDEIDNCWIADTSIQKDINRFKKQGWTVKNEFKYSDGSIKAMEFTAPRNALPIGKANKTKRIMTEEQIQAKRDGAANMRKSKGKNNTEVI